MRTSLVMPQIDTRRVPGLDAARALAAVSVMLAHMVDRDLPGPLRYLFTGAPAVSAFFVISGFCIHYPFIGRPPASWRFLAARWFRVCVPSLCAMVLAWSAGIWVYNPVDGYILWSIVCELFYYSLYVAFLGRIAPHLSWWTLLGGAVVLAYTVVVFVGSDQYGSTSGFGWSLNWVVGLPSWLLGCILAERVASRRSGGWPIPLLWARIGIAATASVLFWATMTTSVRFDLTLIPFSVLVVLWLEIEIEHGRKQPGLLDLVGRWSFSIYLMHVVAWTWLERLFPKVSAVILTVPVLLVCYAFYRLIEVPSHQTARRFMRWAKATELPALDPVLSRRTTIS